MPWKVNRTEARSKRTRALSRHQQAGRLKCEPAFEHHTSLYSTSAPMTHTSETGTRSFSRSRARPRKYITNTKGPTLYFRPSLSLLCLSCGPATSRLVPTADRASRRQRERETGDRSDSSSNRDSEDLIRESTPISRFGNGREINEKNTKFGIR